MLREIFGPNRKTCEGNEEECITRSFMICTPHQILFRWSIKENEMDGGMWHGWGTGEVRTGVW